MTRLTLAIALVVAHTALGLAQDRDDRDVYESSLRELHRGAMPTVLVIDATPAPLLPPSTDPTAFLESDWETLGPEAASLRPAAEATQQMPITPFEPESFPDAARLVQGEDITEFFRTTPRGPDPYHIWRLFRERFGTGSYYRLSRPAVTDDGRQALLAYAYMCGAVCGEGGYMWLRRASPTEPWAVVRKVVKFVG